MGAVYFLFPELSLFNTCFVTSDFSFWFLHPLFRRFSVSGEWFSRILTYSFLVPGFRQLFCQLACMTERSGDGRNLH